MNILDELGAAYSQLDIYDENLNLLRSFHGEDEMPYYEFREKNTSLHLFVHPKGDYYGAINARGDQIIPAKYTDFGEVKFLNEAGRRDDEIFYLFGNNNLLSVFDYGGKQIISEGHTQYMSMGNCFIAINPDRTYAIYTKEGNKLLDGVSSYFAATKNSGKRDCSYLRGNANPSGNLFLFVKGDQLYYLLDGKLSLAGPQTFEFSSVYLRLYGNTIIDQQGKVVDVAGIQLTKWYGGCPVQLQKLPVQEEVLSKPLPKKKPIERNYQWKQTSDYKTKENWWTLSDLSGKNLSSRHFDYPFNPKEQTGKIFRVSEQYGLMGEDFNELLPPEYKYIFPVGKGYIVYKDSLWRFYKLDGTFSPAFDDVSMYEWKQGEYFVFKDGKIGVLSDSWSYLVPLTDSLELVKKTDLVTLLQLDKVSQFNLQSIYRIVQDVKSVPGYKELNNSQLILFAYQRSTANSIMEMGPVDRAFLSNPSKFSFRYDEEITDKISYIQQPNWYSMELKSYVRYLYNYDEFPNHRNNLSKYFNYKIIRGQLVPIFLKDIVPNEASMKKLDELLLRKLTAEQVFGQNCTDIAGKLEILKSNFLITRSSLRFSWPSYPKFELELSFKQLKEILSKEFQKQITEF
jgi:hypothetical protein